MSESDSKSLGRRLELSEQKRIRLKNRVPATTGDEETFLWSMVDILTLLLIFFILFYSRALDSRIKGQPPTVDIPAAAQREKIGVNMPDRTGLFPHDHGLERGRIRTKEVDQRPDESLESLQNEVMNMAAGYSDGSFEVYRKQGRLVIVMGERITFDAGESELLDDFKPVLTELSALIASKNGYQVMVAGHTDDTSICTARYPSNWELSAARSIRVAKFLINSGVSAERVSIEGYAEFRPLNDNDSLKNREANRRVEITLVKEGRG